MTGRRNAAVAIIAALGASTAFAYVRSTVSGGASTPPLFQSAPESIRFFVEETVAPDLRNADNRPVISPSSDPLAALQAALDAWSGLSGSALNFEPLQTTSAGADSFDGRNVFVFSDTPETRSLSLGALAVTVLRVEPTGRITDADVIFNPNVRPGNNQIPFSTDLALNTVDLQGAATHAVGLAAGAGLNPVIGSALYPFADQASPDRRKLSSDDLAFARQVYPAPDAPNDLAEITGQVMAEGVPAGGVLVSAIAADDGVVVSSLSALDDGTYRIRVPAAPQARYRVYAEALDGPVLPRNIQDLDISKFRTDVRPRFFGGNQRPIDIDLRPGQSAVADFNLSVDVAALQIGTIGLDDPGGSGAPRRLTEGAVEMTAGRAYDLLLSGVGIDRSLGIGEIRLMAPDLRVRPGSVRVDPVLTVRGAPVVRLTVDVGARSERHTGSIALVRSRAMDVYTGALLIEPQRPAISDNGVVNAADFLSGAVSPGMIATIFGSAMGPDDPGVQATEFDPATGKLPTELAGVSMLVDGIPAPLFFVLNRQANFQIPFEASGAGSVEIVVLFDGLESAPISIPVASSSPALFALAGGAGQVVALLPDGTVGAPENPAQRGGFVTLFATGHGALTDAPMTGAPAGASPLSRLVGLTVEIGGVEVAPEDLLFAGLAPGFVGLVQINVRLADDLPAGDAVTIRIHIDGVASRADTSIAIR